MQVEVRFLPILDVVSAAVAVHVDWQSRSTEGEGMMPAERPRGPMSRIVGLYKMMMRRQLEHFFPDGQLEMLGEQSGSMADPTLKGRYFRILDDPDGLGVVIELFNTQYLFQPGSPSPFLPIERRLIEAVMIVLDRRYQFIYDTEATIEEILEYAIEDQIVAEFLQVPGPVRLTSALEALRAAALSTYENQRVSTGALLLGTPEDPAYPGRVNPPGAPRYSVRLASVKSFHRVCDGFRTVYVVDRSGELAWPVDLERWSRKVQGDQPLLVPCARTFESHARATLTGDHVVAVLTPAQQIKVFAEGAVRFVYADAHWRLLDTPCKFATWKQAVGKTDPPDLGDRIFQAALNLLEERKGAMFVILREPARSLPALLAPGDRILSEIATDDPEDPENLSPRLAKRALHHLVRGQQLADLDGTILEAIAGIDGAVVTDRQGLIHSFGAILRISSEVSKVPRAVEGARTTAALAASHHGPVLKVSEDGSLAMFLTGRKVWTL